MDRQIGGLGEPMQCCREAVCLRTFLAKTTRKKTHRNCVAVLANTLTLVITVITSEYADNATTTDADRGIRSHSFS